MTTILQAIILGIVQGITEWLPVSSSGHLVIAQELMNVRVPLLFDILLHVGTLIVVCIVFWEDLKGIVLSPFVARYKKYRMMLQYIVIGTIVTGVVGLLLKDVFESFFGNLFVVGIGLLITAGFLFSTKKHVETRSIGWKDAVLIGLFQALALVPGISRSGSTISVGLFRGLEREEAARFSFLLLIPAVLGATILQLFDTGFVGLEFWPAVTGTVVAMVVGYVCLKGLLVIIKHEKFHYFGWYCLVVGLLLVGISIF